MEQLTAREDAYPVTLTDVQLEWLAIALNSRSRRMGVTPAQRTALARICADMDRTINPPERLLVAFKVSLFELADRLGIAHGSERESLVVRLVSGFIEELYSSSPRGQTNGAGTADQHRSPVELHTPLS